MSFPEVDPLEDSYYLHERYLSSRRRPAFLRPYYALKPLLPRAVQLAARRRYMRRQIRTTFPAWPFEDVLLRRSAERVRSELSTQGAERIPFVNFWPNRKRFAVVLTHDVEGAEGVQRIPHVLAVEQRHGFVSAWNFVAEWYSLDGSVLEAVRAAGCEVGLHGIKHDGSLFRDRSHFERQLPKIRHYVESWGAKGFRSPSTFRNAEWMHELPCLYDSSFPHTDPFQPQPGGCCSIFPFFFGDVVELPITLDQDQTLFELLRHDSIDLWVSKSRWLIENHGLINLIIHPDYMTPKCLDLYEDFLRFLARQQGGWHALPAAVAEWWRVREGSRCSTTEDGKTVIADGGSDAATIAWASWEQGKAVYEA
jgi:peptidoglycan/xylan/chitin deacetylase (PgdA/CDA1 family)